METPVTINSKLPTAGTTIFSVMTGLAVQHKALNLAQGFPEEDCANDLKALVTRYMRKGLNQYAPMPGVMKLREAIAEKTQRLYSGNYHPETEVTVTAGATQALFTAIAAFVREGDEVIVFEPCYDSYVPAIELNGGKAVFAQLKLPGYSPDWDEVKKLIKRQTRMIIINTPNNPAGSVWTAADMSKLEKLTRNTDIIILSDEVYEHMVFDGLEHQSIARYPKLAERSLIVSSFGKTFHQTGWKIGYCLAPERIMAEFRKAHQFVVFSVHHPAQWALADFLAIQKPENTLPEYYQKKRDLFRSLIQGSKWEILPCQGTYFQLLRYAGISDENDVAFARKMVLEKGLAAIPVSVFYHKPVDKKVLRFCFAKNDETLEKAARILHSF
jgi:methionine aminotransferase